MKKWKPDVLLLAIPLFCTVMAICKWFQHSGDIQRCAATIANNCGADDAVSAALVWTILAPVSVAVCAMIYVTIRRERLHDKQG